MTRKVLEPTHTDLCGPITPTSLGGSEGDGAGEDLCGKSKHKRERKIEETRHGYGEGEPTFLHSFTNSHS